MCYAGGPRCYADAKRDYDKALEKLGEFKKKHGTEEEIAATGFGALREYRALKKDVVDKRVDLQQTKEFVDELSEALDSGSVSGQLEDLVTQTMHESKAGYDAQILAFDQRNNTVLTRKPSRYGTAEGISHLAKDVERSQTKSEKEQERALRAYEHAVATRDRLLNGDIKLPEGFVSWKKPSTPETLPTGNLPKKLEEEEHRRALLIRGLQHMMRDNAKNPFTVRHRTNLAIRESKIAESEEKIRGIKTAMSVTAKTQDYGTHQEAYKLFTENSAKLNKVQSRIREEEQHIYLDDSPDSDLSVLRAKESRLKAQQKDLAMYLNSEISK